MLHPTFARLFGCALTASPQGLTPSGLGRIPLGPAPRIPRGSPATGARPRDSAREIQARVRVPDSEAVSSTPQPQHARSQPNAQAGREDDAAEVVAEASAERAETLLADLTARAPEDAAEVRELLSYREGTAGRLLTDKFLRLSPAMTVEDALGAVRTADPDVETVTDLYVVIPSTHNGTTGEKLIGVLSLRQLVQAEPDGQIEQLMASDVVTVTVDTDQQEVARLISKYDFLAIPVVDREGDLAGIITVDDVIDVLVEEFNEVVSLALPAPSDSRRPPGKT